MTAISETRIRKKHYFMSHYQRLHLLRSFCCHKYMAIKYILIDYKHITHKKFLYLSNTTIRGMVFVSHKYSNYCWLHVQIYVQETKYFQSFTRVENGSLYNCYIIQQSVSFIQKQSRNIICDNTSTLRIYYHYVPVIHIVSIYINLESTV